jgi:NAD(P)-dependent dehydrogenase (short-subunit alcohol dehydrogenase family)
MVPDDPGLGKQASGHPRGPPPAAGRRPGQPTSSWVPSTVSRARRPASAVPGAAGHSYPGVAYPASKAAVNMITVQYARAFPAMRITPSNPATPRPT